MCQLGLHTGFFGVCVWGGGEGGGGVVGYYHNVTHEFAAHVL